MTRSVYLVGEPGSGKTAAMTALLSRYEIGEWENLDKGWGVERLYIENVLKGTHLGVTRPSFGGTDALALHTQPLGIRWLESGPVTGGRIYGEGARLASPNFMMALAKLGPVDVWLLDGDLEVFSDRRDKRNHEFKPQFVKGARTRAHRLFDWAMLSTSPTSAYAIDSTEYTPEQIADEINRVSFYEDGE